MTTSTTLEKDYSTNTIIKNWLTLKIKLEMQNDNNKVKFDYKKFNIVID